MRFHPFAVLMPFLFATKYVCLMYIKRCSSKAGASGAPAAFGAALAVAAQFGNGLLHTFQDLVWRRFRSEARCARDDVLSRLKKCADVQCCIDQLSPKPHSVCHFLEHSSCNPLLHYTLPSYTSVLSPRNMPMQAIIILCAVLEEIQACLNNAC